MIAAVVVKNTDAMFGQLCGEKIGRGIRWNRGYAGDYYIHPRER